MAFSLKQTLNFLLPFLFHSMWSVGVIVYILLGGYAPFEGQLGDLARVIIDGKYEFHPEYWRHISSSAKELIKALLQVNPNKRITASEALISEWMVVEAESLISRDLTSAQSQIRKALPLNKVRGAVNAVSMSSELFIWFAAACAPSFTVPRRSLVQIIAANKLGEAGQLFTKGLIKDLGNSSEELKARKSKMPAPPRPKQVDGKIIEDSTSGKAFVELFEPEAQIGQGEFSVVLEATHKQSRIRYAVKRIDRRNLHPSDAVAVQDEIDALRTVAGCPQIVRLHDIYDEVDTTYLILENMRGGDLIDRIIRRQSYTEYDAKQVCEALLEGVKFCHKRRIANRNLKPENLLLVSPESDTEVKISDFGYAKKVIYPNSLRTQCGTEGYVAPEILQHNPSYDVSCDMWSLGVIIYILLGGYRPFRGTSKEVMRQIRYGEFEFHDTYWRHVSTDAKELIRRMLTVNPEDRITAKEALNSAWITADDDLLSHFDLSSNQDKLRGY
jgi:serine/threonine protein kinase